MIVDVSASFVVVANNFLQGHTELSVSFAMLTVTISEIDLVERTPYIDWLSDACALPLWPCRIVCHVEAQFLPSFFCSLAVCICCVKVLVMSDYKELDIACCFYVKSLILIKSNISIFIRSCSANHTCRFINWQQKIGPERNPQSWHRPTQFAPRKKSGMLTWPARDANLLEPFIWALHVAQPLVDTRAAEHFGKTPHMDSGALPQRFLSPLLLSFLFFFYFISLLKSPYFLPEHCFLLRDLYRPFSALLFALPDKLSGRISRLRSIAPGTLILPPPPLPAERSPKNASLTIPDMLSLSCRIYLEHPTIYPQHNSAAFSKQWQNPTRTNPLSDYPKVNQEAHLLDLTEDRLFSQCLPKMDSVLSRRRSTLMDWRILSVRRIFEACCTVASRRSKCIVATFPWQTEAADSRGCLQSGNSPRSR